MSSPDEKRYERLVLRLNQELHDALTERAEKQNRSVNGEICTAAHQWLYERDTLVLVKDRLLASASDEIAHSIQSRTPVFELGPDGDQDICKVPVRLSENVNFDLREAHAHYKARAKGFVSLNAFMKMMISWWISHNFQLDECSKAIYQDFKANTGNTRVPSSRFPRRNRPMHAAAMSA